MALFFFIHLCYYVYHFIERLDKHRPEKEMYIDILRNFLVAFIWAKCPTSIKYFEKQKKRGRYYIERRKRKQQPEKAALTHNLYRKTFDLLDGWHVRIEHLWTCGLHVPTCPPSDDRRWMSAPGSLFFFAQDPSIAKKKRNV